MSTIMTTSPRKASAVMQLLLAVALIAFAPFLVPAHATDLGLGYDANGNVNSRTTPSGTTTFNYDALDRVQNEAGPAGARTHVYDPNGNRTSDTAGTTAAYTPNTDKLQTINGITVTLDASGNLTADGTYLYVWNALNQLAELHKADNTLIASYYYDYQNRRSRKVTTTAAPQGATTTYYSYDGQNHLIAETGPGNQPIATYVWNGDTLTGFITYQPTRTVYTVQVDQLGSPFQVRTLTGTVVWRWESEAYGKTQPNQDVDGDGTQLTLNLRFPGQYYDPESGLHYNLNRYYSPKLARYLTPDPIGLAGGANVFGYVKQNPLNYSDPKGLCGPLTPLCIWIAANAPELTLGATIVAEFASGVPNPVSTPATFAGRAAQELTHDVYLGIKNGEPVYAGISKALMCRASQHGDRFDELRKLTTSPVTRDQARAIEQVLINNNPQFQNQINSIAPTRSWYDQAVQWGQQWLSNGR